MQGIKFSKRSTCTYMMVKCDSTPNKNENEQDVRKTLCKHRGKRVGNDRENYSCTKERKSMRRWDENEKVGDSHVQIGVGISLITRMFMLLTRARTSVGMSVSGR